ncbi:hypothetical protein HYPSUDRAFT_32107 [Hypholoma sublateritium FD-334 SS-4]|uniref:BOD1/SHG1 domain-containing protein n=1 Tax=Hypholoma sublateritium (strain FD-334 SS-4) TaxID=945553 RepID=A0A0D2PGS3_HYPSF|nr:hypothetical protein HYPSUDRAFT_32107 [Hypholoma sublateritium FD-334 SS-4]
MPIDTPTALVEEFKKSGEFDRLRRELLAQFQQDESYTALKSRVEEIGRQRLTTDQTLQYLTQEMVQKELAQEVERYPIVERAVADVRVFSDPTFLANMQASIQRILQEDQSKRASVLPNTGETIGTSTNQQRARVSIEKGIPNGQPAEEPVRLSSVDTALVDILKSTTDDTIEAGSTDIQSILPEDPHHGLELPSKISTKTDTKADDMDVDSPGN